MRPVLGVHWKDWCWSWNSNTLANWCEELIHLKRPWCWERLKVGGEGDNRGWDGWMASPTQWTWVWVNSGSWWWTGKPGVWGHKESDTTERLNWLNWAFLIDMEWYIIVVLICISLNDIWCGASFHMLTYHLYIFFGNMFIKVINPL